MPLDPITNMDWNKLIDFIKSVDYLCHESEQALGIAEELKAKHEDLAERIEEYEDEDEY